MHVVDLVTRGADDEDDRDSVFEKKVYQRQSTMHDSVMLLRELSASQKSSDNVSSISNFDGSPFLKASSFDCRKRSESVLTLWEELLFEPDEVG
ncbi:hypothetical protein EB796_000263 [Bugula neritina]|uniref:Uncharacterized protein n=1 Tax=Bugula neritina TaxID=10212 RepID=A0A7J7KT84_BUGNE|nr:hypothetical protein EB796_000263 [Bugula neritina]